MLLLSRRKIFTRTSAPGYFNEPLLESSLLDLGGIQFSEENFLFEGEMGPVCWDFWWCSFVYKAVFLVFESRRMPGVKFLRNIIKTKCQDILMFLRNLFIIFVCKRIFSRNTWLKWSEGVESKIKWIY